jgi:ankyrin repeat protein
MGIRAILPAALLCAAVAAGQDSLAESARSVDSYGSTALHRAVDLDDLQAVELLLGAGADATARNRYGIAPLSLAAANGNAAIIRKLLAAGADPNTEAAGGETALMTAARTGSRDAVDALILAGADLNKRESARRQTALTWASAEGYVPVIRALVVAGAEINARSGSPDAGVPRGGGRAVPPMPDYFTRSNGGPLNTIMTIDSMTPLMFAVREGRLDAVRALLDLGANVNEAASNGCSVLVLAIINAHYDVAAFLLEHGADPNAAGQGWTPLHQVVTTPRLSYGRFPHPQRTGRTSPLDLAKRLLEKGAKVDARMTVPTMGDGCRARLNRLGATPLLLAAKGAYPEMIELLLAHGADPHATAAEGTTVLMLAAGVAIFNEGDDAGTEAETLASIKLLVEHGADVNQKDANGETALHGAAYRGHNDVVQYLADHGAGLDVPNRIGWTPLTIADGVLYAEFFKQHRDTAALLRQLMRAQGMTSRTAS